MSTQIESSEYFTNNGLVLEARKIFVVHDEHGNYVETELFFTLPFDQILAPFAEKLANLYEWTPEMGGKPPYPPVAMFKAILYGKVNYNMSDRHLERYLLRHPDMARALGFNEIPSHHTFSYFKRERLTVDLLVEVFNALRDHLVTLGTIDFESITFDSAPVVAFVNLPKANREVCLDDALACALFQDPTYVELATALIGQFGYKRTTVKYLQKRLCVLNLVVFNDLGGFLSQSKAVKYLTKDDHAILRVAVSGGGKLPSEATISGCKKKLRVAQNSAEFVAFRAYLEAFFSAIRQGQETNDKIFFPTLFAVLQESCSMVDPDARLGYCAAKKRPFLGYRVQLVIDDKKKFRSKLPSSLPTCTIRATCCP